MNNLKEIKDYVAAKIDNEREDLPILAEEHKKVLDDILENGGKYVGSSFVAKKTETTFSSGVMSFNNNALNESGNFTLSFSQNNLDGMDFGKTLSRISLGDLLVFKDFEGRVAYFEYQSHSLNNTGTNPFYDVVVVSDSDNVNFTYDTEELDCVISILQSGETKLNIYNSSGVLQDTTDEIHMGEDMVYDESTNAISTTNTLTTGTGLNSIIFKDSNSTATTENSISLGTNNQSTGLSSVTMGLSNIASNNRAIAIGQSNQSTGNASFSCNISNQSNGAGSFSCGSSNRSNGLGSFSANLSNTIESRSGSAFGENHRVFSFVEHVIGNYSTNYNAISDSSFEEEDRLFNVGNGTGQLDKHDAFTILKNGQTGVGIDNFETNTTGEKLQVNGKIKATDINFTGLPTSTTGLSSGDVWNDNGTLKIV